MNVPLKTVPLKKSAIERVSGLLVTVDETFIEKDWYVVQLLRLRNDMQAQSIQIVIDGGTSLAPSGHKYYREARKKITIKPIICLKNFVLLEH